MVGSTMGIKIFSKIKIYLSDLFEKSDAELIDGLAYDEVMHVLRAHYKHQRNEVGHMSNKMELNLTKMDTDQLKSLLIQIIAIEKGNYDQIIKEHTNE